jgi:hypothetical protein
MVSVRDPTEVSMPRSSKPTAIAAFVFLSCGGSSTQLGGAEAVAAGYFHTCAIVSGGVQCWGDDSEGQVGEDALNIAVTSPVPVVGLTSGVSGIAAGGLHTCAIVNGGVQCWGANYYGQLGNNSTSTVATAPVQVLGLTSGATAVAAGYSHTCAIVSGGVECWGSNSSGQLGNGSAGGVSLVPVQVSGLSVGVQAIAAGYAHTCALVNSGVQCWGSNSNGQLGDGSPSDSSVPVQVSGLTSGVDAIAAGAGSLHSCALASGSVQCWGSNSNGQLGNGSPTDSSAPVQVSNLTSGVDAIAVGAQHSCALLMNGVQCWGSNSHGQLGNGSTIGSSVPVPVSGLATGGVALAAGGTHTCAIVSGAGQCWGQNQFGQLGNGSLNDSDLPVPVE